MSSLAEGQNLISSDISSQLSTSSSNEGDCISSVMETVLARLDQETISFLKDLPETSLASEVQLAQQSQDQVSYLEDHNRVEHPSEILPTLSETESVSVVTASEKFSGTNVSDSLAGDLLFTSAGGPEENERNDDTVISKEAVSVTGNAGIVEPSNHFFEDPALMMNEEEFEALNRILRTKNAILHLNSDSNSNELTSNQDLEVDDGEVSITGSVSSRSKRSTRSKASADYDSDYSKSCSVSNKRKRSGGRAYVKTEDPYNPSWEKMVKKKFFCYVYPYVWDDERCEQDKKRIFMLLKAFSGMTELIVAVHRNHDLERMKEFCTDQPGYWFQVFMRTADTVI